MNSGIGLVFPGQGSQSVGMGKALCDAHPRLKQVYDEASSVLGYDSAALCFDGPAERLNLTEHTQPALLVSSIAALKTLDSAGLKPVAVAGHSLGEYSALVAAGGTPMSACIAPFRRYAQSGEINFAIEDKDGALNWLRKEYGTPARGATIDELDGVTIDCFAKQGWWCNIRKSNTEPLLRLNLEAATPADMERRRDEVLAIIRG